MKSVIIVGTACVLLIATATPTSNNGELAGIFQQATTPIGLGDGVEFARPGVDVRFVASRSDTSDAEFVAILNEINGKSDDTQSVAVAWMKLGRMQYDRGDDAEAMKSLERGVRLYRPDSTPAIADADSQLDFACREVGDYCIREGRYSDALHYWSKFEGRHFCGNGQAAGKALKAHRIMLCELHLGNHVQAANVGLQIVFQTRHCLLGWDGTPAVLLYRLCDAAGQRDDLMRMCDRVDAPILAEWDGSAWAAKLKPEDREQRRPSQQVRFCDELQRLAKEGKAESLALYCRRDTRPWTEGSFATAHFDWRAAAAADALAQLGENGFAVIEQSYKPGYSFGEWLLYSLGKTRSSGSLQLLKRFADKSYDQEMAKFVLALRLRGAEGEALAKALASRSPKAANAVAQHDRQIRHALAIANAQDTWPRPKNRSLPAALPVRQEVNE
ncbi:MAG TPA: hypothetical protein VMP01_08340 [Pirellulaceae bacterium]|nr:hypothetical protein [Pirellulaceae bacterium]